MFKVVLLSALAISFVRSQDYVPLVQKRFTWDTIPEKVDTDKGLVRGEQLGYNRCNSTTEGPSSLCQTAIINSLDDFCFWAPPTPGRAVGEIEGEMIAWCTQPGHGTRVMADGTITGVQFTKSPDYVQVVGFISDQSLINMVPGDAGGEMDPHGADLRGNPMGGLLFSNAFTGSYIQVVEWHNFMGGNQFCLKACDPRGQNDAEFCQHIYDTQGCGFNAPSNARDGVFESCESDNQAFPGQGAPVPPASRSCSTYASTDIYGPTGTVRVPIPGASSLSFSPIPRPTRTVSSSSSPPASTSASDSRSSSAAPSATATSGAMPNAAGGYSALGVIVLGALTMTWL